MGSLTDAGIGTSSMIVERFSVKGNLRIDGIYINRTLLGDTMYVGSTGRVRADIFAKNVEVEGSVVGNIRAEEKVSLLSTARVVGDIQTPELYIQEGVVYSGTCTIVQGDGIDVQQLIHTLYNQ